MDEIIAREKLVELEMDAEWPSSVSRSRSLSGASPQHLRAAKPALAAVAASQPSAVAQPRVAPFVTEGERAL